MSQSASPSVSSPSSHSPHFVQPSHPPLSSGGPASSTATSSHFSATSSRPSSGQNFASKSVTSSQASATLSTKSALTSLSASSTQMSSVSSSSRRVSLGTATWTSTHATSTTPAIKSTTTTEVFPPGYSNVNNDACKDPPACSECLDGFALQCREDPNGGALRICQCEWNSGCRDDAEYGECIDMDCSREFRKSYHCDTVTVDPGMYPNGHCYCRDAPCRVEDCPDVSCGPGMQPACDANLEE
ncbi:hypothetical protein PG993_006872 [Apiospora rasikravindrae]|uniref:Uncharacterized protein n=1 Tax=Apiospora rasikravindrae TaxID=990691 RepID=A0ABR1SVV2_9PEZI